MVTRKLTAPKSAIRIAQLRDRSRRAKLLSFGRAVASIETEWCADLFVPQRSLWTGAHPKDTIDSIHDRLKGPDKPLIQHLRVVDHKGLKECTLLNLENIHVICGKNNSGKTTLLEAISSLDKRQLGRSFAEDDLEQLIDGASAGHQHSSNTSFRTNLKTALSQVANGLSQWFPKDQDTFRIELENRVKGTLLVHSFNFHAGLIAGPYARLLADEVATVLVPAKRTLELHISVDSNAKPQSNGSGLINWLFWSKNQPINSAAYITFSKVLAAFEAISSGYTFWIHLGDGNTLSLSFGKRGQPLISAADSGLGLQDLLVLLYFIIEPQCRLVCIEEPESHIHPAMQKKLLTYMKEQSGKQFFLSTHSNVFVNNALVDRVFLTRFTDTVQVDDSTTRASMLDDLGYSVTDNLVSDLVILVEGPTDIPVLEEMLLTLGTLKEFEIKMWPVGGDIMDQLDLSVFGSYSILAVVDKDPGSAKVRRAFVKNCRDAGIPVTHLKRYSMENYFSLNALRTVFKGQIPAQFNNIEPETKLEDQIHMNVKRNNREIARAMTKDEIEQTDDLYRFLKKVDKMCRSIIPPTT